MGLVLGIPSMILSIVTNRRGVIFALKELWALRRIKQLRAGPKKGRFDLYDPQERRDLYKINLKINPIEEKAEYRQDLSQQRTVTDNVFFYGINSEGDFFVVRVSRNPGGLASAWLLLRLKDGSTLKLPTETFFIEPKTGEESFVAGGLRIKCLVPMRTWRISYNGLLKKKSHLGEESIHHVRFGLIWIASSSLHDLRDELHAPSLAKFMAQQPTNTDIRSVTRYLDSYVQMGNINGILQFDREDEIVLHLWGVRKRSKDLCDSESPVNHNEQFIISKEGHFLHHGYVKFPTLNGHLEYGFLVFSNDRGGPSEVVSSKIKDDNSEEILMKFEGFKMTFNIKHTNEVTTFLNGDITNGRTNLSLSGGQVDESDEAVCLVLKYSNFKDITRKSVALPPPRINLTVGRGVTNRPRDQLVLNLKDSICRLTEVSGGKGASLADLTKLSSVGEIQTNRLHQFKVPEGLVVSTAAGDLFLNQNDQIRSMISRIKEATKNRSVSALKETCQSCVQEIETLKLPSLLKESIENNLNDAFGDEMKTLKFAIRSSASGEDSEELSAAGQMDTYLGVQGLNEIHCSVVKCWASQFSFIAIQYKRQNGQELISPMAVVIQKMIPVEVAGVMFSCDPVTGNPGKVTITANYGIGESVVSATAEPDTIVIGRNEIGLTGEVQVEIGKKSAQVVLNEYENGTMEKETDSDSASKCCLELTKATQLAEIGVMVESVYGCPVDVEWGILGDIIYLLQARPITTVDIESDYELKHELDSPMKTEDEYSSTANVGEVLPGASSFLAVNSITKCFEIPAVWHFGKRDKNMISTNPYYARGLSKSQNHQLFNILDSILRFYHGEESMVTDLQLVAIFGRIIKEEHMMEMAAKRNKHYPANTSLLQIYYIIKDMMTIGGVLKAGKEKYWGSKMDLQHCKDSLEAYDELWRQYLAMSETVSIHQTASMVSSFYNGIFLSTLVKQNGGWSSEAYTDLAYVLSTCYDVESVDVPYAIESLWAAINNHKDWEVFKSLPVEEAHQWLLREDHKLSNQFQDFLKNHGHRCYKEFDFASKPWHDEPHFLVKTLQEMSGSKSGDRKRRETIPTAETIRNLKSGVTWKSRLLFRFVIPFCRKAVGMRERSKSLMIKVIDAMRGGFMQLADRMFREGILPDPELIYYLTYIEVEQLIRTRSPKLIQKAFRRKQIFPAMEAVIFPEIMRGLIIPIDYEKDKIITEGSLVVTGTPVSNGIAKGLARVATCLSEAADIKPGEILIAYSTDIGWSPYFPMLAGVATEIGGLVSHGAVVAREYGLPCVVGVQGATLKFQTGDLVIVNGNKGTLERI